MTPERRALSTDVEGIQTSPSGSGSEILEVAVTAMVEFVIEGGDVKIKGIVYPSNDAVLVNLKGVLAEIDSWESELSAGDGNRHCPAFRVAHAHEGWLAKWSPNWEDELDEELTCQVCQRFRACFPQEDGNVKAMEKDTEKGGGETEDAKAFEEYLG